MRPYIFTSEPDNPCIIFCDQIVYVAKEGDGSVVVTSNGTRHSFRGVSFEKMRDAVLAGESK